MTVNRIERYSDMFVNFAEILHKHDPMDLKREDGDEYSAEALSILSRFHENMISQLEDEDEAFELAAGIVTQCFNFWFDETLTDFDLEPVTLELLTIYVETRKKTSDVGEVGLNT